jgi:hypothetical protein
METYRPLDTWTCLISFYRHDIRRICYLFPFISLAVRYTSQRTMKLLRGINVAINHNKNTSRMLRLFLMGHIVACKIFKHKAFVVSALQLHTRSITFHASMSYVPHSSCLVADMEDSKLIASSHTKQSRIGNIVVQDHNSVPV